MPRISVIIPAFNVEAYLRETLESLTKQTFSDFEVIIVNDGSTDQTEHIAQSMVDVDPRFSLINQANAGVAIARNVALARAQGEYIYFLDGDDLIVDNAFETMMHVVSQTGCDVYLFGAQKFGLVDLIDHNYDRLSTETTLSGSAYLLASINKRLIIQPSCYITKRDKLLKLSFVPNLDFEDNVFFVQLLAQAHLQVVADNQKLFLRRVRAGSVMTGGVTTRKYESMVRITKLVAAVEFPECSPSEKQALLYFLLGGYFGNACFGSSKIKKVVGLGVRMSNLRLMLLCVKAVGFRFMTLKRVMLAAVPELYQLQDQA